MTTGDGDTMGSNKDSAIWGKIVFGLTAVAMVYFFWWLLIYDHGVTAVH